MYLNTCLSIQEAADQLELQADSVSCRDVKRKLNLLSGSLRGLIQVHCCINIHCTRYILLPYTRYIVPDTLYQIHPFILYQIHCPRYLVLDTSCYLILVTLSQIPCTRYILLSYTTCIVPDTLYQIHVLDTLYKIHRFFLYQIHCPRYLVPDTSF